MVREGVGLLLPRGMSDGGEEKWCVWPAAGSLCEYSVDAEEEYDACGDEGECEGCGVADAG